jgi:hypothetical protein
MLDNASNNDTFVDGIERRAKKAGVPFNASWARLRCMPHTIHLAAIKVRVSISSTFVGLMFPLFEAPRGHWCRFKCRGQESCFACQ